MNRGKKVGSIIHELQLEAMNSTSSITDLLRKVLVVARKLKINDFEQWVDEELNGYNVPLKELPEYRDIVGKVQWFNPFRGWCPVIIEDERILDIVSKVKLNQPITELEHLISSDSDHLIYQIPQTQQNLLSKMFGETAEFRLYFGKSQCQRMIDAVRNIILEWALKLEEDGILGEGLSFSNEEKKEASKNNYTVNNFYGNANGVQIQQNTSHSTQTIINEMDFDKISNFISTLKDNMNQIGLQKEEQKVVESEIENISTELASTEPKPSVLKQSLQSIRTTLEGTAGNLTASGLLYLLGQINF